MTAYGQSVNNNSCLIYPVYHAELLDRLSDYRPARLICIIASFFQSSSSSLDPFWILKPPLGCWLGSDHCNKLVTSFFAMREPGERHVFMLPSVKKRA